MKAFFFDIDGTLVSFKTHRIPQSTIDVLKKIKQQGHLIIIATGRPKSIINNLSQLETPGLVDGYITMNGGYTYVGNIVLSDNPIPHDDLQKIITYTSLKRATNVYMFETEEKYLVRESEKYKEIFYDKLNINYIPCSDESVEKILRNRTVYQITTFFSLFSNSVYCSILFTSSIILLAFIRKSLCFLLACIISIFIFYHSIFSILYYYTFICQSIVLYFLYFFLIK